MQNNQDNINENIKDNDKKEDIAPTKVHLSDNAILHFEKILQRNPEAKGIRLGVKNSGCSGLSYVIGIDINIAENDIVFEHQIGNKNASIQVIIHQDALTYLSGLTVDYVTEGLNSQIKFINPNVKSVCGCGESFSIEK
jgi:iron-sulfur cluster assembly accessory protein